MFISADGTPKAFPSKYRNGGFMTQHGFWNRKELAVISANK
jgi:glucose/arabinose dehydrogenase